MKNKKNILFLSAVYHDIGRTADNLDPMYRYKSWDKLTKLGMTKIFSPEQNCKIKYIIINHCVEDGNEKEDITYLSDDFKRLLYLFKDADALDRVRFNDLNVNFLRNSYSRQLISIAWKIFKYDILLSEIED